MRYGLNPKVPYKSLVYKVNYNENETERPCHFEDFERFSTYKRTIILRRPCYESENSLFSVLHKCEYVLKLQGILM